MPKIPEDTLQRKSKKFQQQLISLISDTGCSNAKFASLVGISKEVVNRATIYAIIPSLRSLIKIADYLNISLDYLLAETENETFYKSESNVTFYQRLKELKKEETYYKIAKVMPFSKNFFYEWNKKGTLPSLEYLDALATYFKVSKDYLLGRTDERD